MYDEGKDELCKLDLVHYYINIPISQKKTYITRDNTMQYCVKCFSYINKRKCIILSMYTLMFKKQSFSIISPSVHTRQLALFVNLGMLELNVYIFT